MKTNIFIFLIPKLIFYHGAFFQDSQSIITGIIVQPISHVFCVAMHVNLVKKSLDFFCVLGVEQMNRHKKVL